MRKIVLVILLLNFGCSSDKQAIELGFRESVIFDTHAEIKAYFQSQDGTVLGGTLHTPIGNAPFPVVVLQFGAGMWERAKYPEASIPSWISEMNFSVFSYDIRGVCESGGQCCPWQQSGYYNLLANDITAIVNLLKTNSLIDNGKIGLIGGSEGGWVVPIVTANISDDIFFTMIFSGPAVTLDEELLYSYYTCDDQGCNPTGLTEEEIWDGLASGELDNNPFDILDEVDFDPIPPYLTNMNCHSLWVYGGKDTSVPPIRSIENLQNIREEYHKDWTILLFPNANHALIENGVMCQTEGQVVPLGGAFDWLRTKL